MSLLEYDREEVVELHPQTLSEFGDFIFDSFNSQLEHEFLSESTVQPAIPP